jgi:hypothetical protein
MVRDGMHANGLHGPSRSRRSSISLEEIEEIFDLVKKSKEGHRRRCTLVEHSV